MFEDSTNELNEAMKDEAFLIDAMDYELGNHEWCITDDVSEALIPLGLSEDSLNEMQSECLTEALRIQREYAMEHIW